MIYGNETCFVENWYADRYGTKNQTTVNSVSTADYGVIDLTSTGTDAYIHMPSLGSFDPATYKYLHILYKVVSGNAFTPQIYYYNAEGGASSTRVVTGPVYNVDGAWHVMTIDMSGHAKWLDSNITGWRFDWSNLNGRNALFGYIALSSSATPPYECDVNLLFPYVPSRTVITYTSGSGTWTCPAGVTSVIVECWGGGGGGGYSTGCTNVAVAGGGGGGAYSTGIIAVTPGNTYAYVVGAGGGVTGGAGADSTFNSTSIVAKGGLGGGNVIYKSVETYGTGGAGGAAASSTGTVKYSGGAGAAGAHKLPPNGYYNAGGGGGCAGSTGAGDGGGDGTAANAYVGGTGTSIGGGNGGNGGLVLSSGVKAGYVGKTYGGGGGGACNISLNSGVTVNGGSGYAGAVRITYEA